MNIPRPFYAVGPFRLAGALAVLLAATVCLGAAGRWYRTEWRHCRTVEIPGEVQPGAECFVFEFYNGGFTLPDAGDVRVIGRGGELKHRILLHEQGGRTRLAAELQRGVGRYDIYYGNPDAPPPDRDWTPPSGLWLETRRYQGRPSPRNAQQFERALEETAGDVYGIGPVERVFHGYNPFGPSGRCVSLYSGSLLIDEPGVYSFASTSDGASMLRIDGKAAVERLGWSLAVPKAQDRADVRLGRGRHRFEFINVTHHPVRQRMVVAWRRPGAPKDKYEVLSAEAFGGVPEAAEVEYRVFGSRVAPDFSFENLDEYHTESGVLVRCRFEDRSAIRATRDVKRAWDFGDGLRGEGEAVEHVYFRPAARKVTLSIEAGGEGHSVTHLVPATQNWARQADVGMDPSLADYSAAIEKYIFDDLRPADLVAAGGFFRDTEKADLALDVCRVSARRAAELTDAQLRNVSKTALYASGASESALGEALLLFRRFEDSARSDVAKGSVAVDLAECLFRGAMGFRAQPQAERALKDFPGMAKEDVRRALLVLGDVALEQGKVTLARDKYEQAEEIAVDTLSPEQRRVSVGAFTRAIEDFILHSRPDAAIEHIDRLEWEIPTVRLDGYSTILRARALNEQKEGDRAAALLERFVQTRPDSTFADDALLLLARIHLERIPARRGKAVEALEKLVEEYPESAHLEDAKALIDRARAFQPD